MEAQSQCNCRLDGNLHQTLLSVACSSTPPLAEVRKPSSSFKPSRRCCSLYTAAFIKSIMWNRRGVERITEAALIANLDEVQQQLKWLMPYKPAVRWPISKISLSRHARPCRTCEHRTLAISGVAINVTEKKECKLDLEALGVKCIHDRLTSKCL